MLKLTMLVTSPFWETVNSCSFVASRNRETDRNEHSRTRIGLEPENAIESADVLERFVDDGDADDRVDDVGVCVKFPSTPASSVTLWPT